VVQATRGAHMGGARARALRPCLPFFFEQAAFIHPTRRMIMHDSSDDAVIVMWDC